MAVPLEVRGRSSSLDGRLPAAPRRSSLLAPARPHSRAPPRERAPRTLPPRPPVPRASGPVDLRRKECAGDVPGPRSACGAATIGRDVLLVGGNRHGDALDVFVLRAGAGFVWERLRPGGDDPGPRFGHATCAVQRADGRQGVFVLGGFDSQSNYGDAFFLPYDPASGAAGAWESVDAALVDDDRDAQGRYFAYASAVSPAPGRVVVFGGQMCAGGPYEYNNETALYDLDAGSRRLLRTGGRAKPTPRAQHSAALLDGGRRMLVLGGCNDETKFASVYVLDLESLQWARPALTGAGLRKQAGLEARPFRVHSARRCVAVFGPQLLVVDTQPRSGRHTATNVLALDTRTWEWWAPLGPDRRCPVAAHAAAVRVGRVLTFVGGKAAPADNSRLATVLVPRVPSRRDRLLRTLAVGHLRSPGSPLAGLPGEVVMGVVGGFL